MKRRTERRSAGGPLRTVASARCRTFALGLAALVLGRCRNPSPCLSSPRRRGSIAKTLDSRLRGNDNAAARLRAGSGGVYSKATHATADARCEGSGLTGRMGAGEQRSAERVCPAAWRRVGEKALCSGPFRDTAESSQPPSRSEQRSAPSLKARAATFKPRQGTALAPRADATQRAPATTRIGPQADLLRDAPPCVAGRAKRRTATETGAPC
jgi:hypothetical protein